MLSYRGDKICPSCAGCLLYIVLYICDLYLMLMLRTKGNFQLKAVTVLGQSQDLLFPAPSFALHCFRDGSVQSQHPYIP